MIIKMIKVLLLFFVASSAMAVSPGKQVVYDGNEHGKVIFSGDSHRMFKCNDCHPKPFPMKKGGVSMALADHMGGTTSCFACHNGKAAFGVKGNCTGCHKK